MDTEIRYLELLRSDLDEAARREPERERHRAYGRGRIARLAKPIGIAAVAVVLSAGVVGLVITNGGFSADDSDEGAATAGPTGTTGGNGVHRELGFLGAPAPQASPAPVDQAGDPSESRVIRTSELGLEIPRGSFDDRFGEAADVATDHDGYVQDSTARDRSGSLTMRVPAASFGDALADLRQLGDVDAQRIEGQDVTAQYVDLQARIRIAKARRQVLLRLMDEANSIAQTIRVQNALDDTQLRIEELQGQLNLLDDRTSLATIRVELREEGVRPEPEVETASLPNAFERAVAGFVGVIAAIVIGLGYLTPLILIALVAWAVVVLVRRRRMA